MSEVTGSEAPLVIDTPFGRLSTEPLDNVVRTLPGLVEQLVLLVTDEELNESALKSLSKKTGAQYWLDFDDSSGMTSIVSGKARAGG
jgi:DNA sulfur modification protein DndD